MTINSRKSIRENLKERVHTKEIGSSGRHD
jgi:hypothetical protein